MLASYVARKRGARGRGRLLALAGTATLSAGGWLGGHLSYTLGAGVTAGRPQPERRPRPEHLACGTAAAHNPVSCPRHGPSLFSTMPTTRSSGWMSAAVSSTGTRARSACSRSRATQAQGQPVAELIIPERLRAAHRAGIERFLADGVGSMLNRRVQMPAMRPDGTEFPVEMTISALQQQAGWLFSGVRAGRLGAGRGRAGAQPLVDELHRALRDSQRQFDAIVGAMSDPVTIRDREQRIVYANRAGLAYLGFESLEELRATSPDQIMSEYRVVGEDGQSLSMDDMPSVRILRGEPVEPLLIRTVNQRTNEERWNLLKAAPLLDADGAADATIMVIEDVTEQKRAEQRTAFLARASDLLSSSLDYEQTLQYGRAARRAGHRGLVRGRPV